MANASTTSSPLSAPQHDVFLSYNSHDAEFVRELAERLRAEGLRPWLDQWELRPGDSIQRSLAEVLDTVPAIAIVLGTGGTGPWHGAEIEAAIHRRLYDRGGGLRLVPVLLPGVNRTDRNTIPVFLRDTLWVEFRADRPYERSLRELVHGLRGWRDSRESEPQTAECPYRGLEYFDVEHARFFHGRGALTQWLLDKLRRPLGAPEPPHGRGPVSQWLLDRLYEKPAAEEPNRLLAIVGASGSGKSSLARAGVLAQMKQGELPRSESWAYAIMRPGPDPLLSLATSLAAARDPASDPGKVLELDRSLEQSDKALDLFTNLLLGESAGDRRLVLLVDQFEELFTLAPDLQADAKDKAEADRQRRRAFVRNLFHAATVLRGRTIVILTMRADFLGKCAAYDELPAMFSGYPQELVGPLNELELRDVIERPAWQVGCSVEPGLVELLVEEVHAQRGNLPLLQYTLAELWKKREGNALTLAAYHDLGGITGVLNRRAEQVFASFSAEQQHLCEDLFLRLTQPGAGTEDTKRRVKRQELDLDAPTSATVVTLLARLSDKENRLLVTDAEGVEIAHEALIRGWDRLRGWINANRVNVQRHRRLTEAAAAWDAARRAGMDEARLGGLLDRTPRLEDALELRAEHPTWLNVLEAEFVSESEKAQRRAREQEEATRRREVEDAQRLKNQADEIAQQQRRRVRMLRRFSIGLAGLLVASIGLGTWGWVSMRAARVAEDKWKHEAKRAEDAEVTARDEAKRANLASHLAGVRLAVSEDPTAAALILGEEEPEVIQTWLRDAVQVSCSAVARLVFRGHENDVTVASFSPDGRWVVTASWDKTARVWRSDGTGEPVVLRGHEYWVLDASFSPDGRWVVTASWDQTARVWRSDGTGGPVVLRHEGAVHAASFSPDGRWVVTASEDRLARVWRSDGTGEPVVLRGHEGAVRAASFSPDGRWVVTVSEDKTARVWRSDGTGQPIVLRGHEGAVHAASFSPDGRWVVTASWDQTARVWRSDGTGEPVVFRGHQGVVHAASFSPDGRQVVTASDDKKVRVWHSDGTGEPVVLCGHEGGVQDASFSPDGRWVVTASWDKTARVWRSDGSGEPVVFRGHEGGVQDASFSPDGRWVVTISRDQTARVWHSEGTGEPVVFRHESEVFDASFSPDGRWVVTASWDKTARVWRSDGMGSPVVLRHDYAVHAASFSPDGHWVVTASLDKTARVWRSDGTGSPVVLQHEEDVKGASFSPDGRWVVTASEDQMARVWRSDGTGVPVVLRHEDDVYGASFSPDGSRVVTASRDKRAQVWRSDGTGEPVVLRHEDEVRAASFSPDGRWVVTISRDNAVRVWRSDGTGEPLVFRHESELFDASFSPDGRWVVTASWDKTARVWRSDGTGSPLVLRGHEEAVHDASFSPDGRWIVTASWDKTARVWRSDGTGESAVLRGHEARVLDASFSPDGHQVVTTSWDGTARVWTVDPLALRAGFRAMTSACLTPRQRQRYLAESTEEATAAWETCERSHSRLPPPQARP